MKLILVLTLTVLISFQAFSQKKSSRKNDHPTWFFLSVGGNGGASMFFEKHFFEGSEINAAALNPCYGFQGKFGIMFPFNMGLAYEYSGLTLNQKYEIKSNVIPSENYTDDIKLGTNGHSILLRAGSLESGYLEIGPRFGTLADVPTFTGKNKYVQKYTSLEFGFGGPLYFHEAFDISLGIRLSYALTSIMEKDNYPYASPKYSTHTYTSTYTTNPFTAQVRLDFHWHIGYFRTAKCDGHTGFIFFGS